MQQHKFSFSFLTLLDLNQKLTEEKYLINNLKNSVHEQELKNVEWIEVETMEEDFTTYFLLTKCH
jgi:hypothetical protein